MPLLPRRMALSRMVLTLALVGSLPLAGLTIAPSAQAAPKVPSSPKVPTAPATVPNVARAQMTNPVEPTNTDADPEAVRSSPVRPTARLSSAAGLTPVYDLVNSCVKVSVNGRYLGPDGVGGVALRHNQAGASPMLLAPAGLSRYTIRDRDGAWLFQSIFATVMRGKHYGNEADWTVQKTPEGAYTIRNSFTNKGIRFNGIGGVITGNEPQPLTLEESGGCYAPKTIDLGVSGPLPDKVDPTGQVPGLVDGHAHLTANLGFGGRFKCGAPFSPGGDETALAACASHSSIAPGGVFNAVISGTELPPVNAGGWPNFDTWPRGNQFLFEQGYYKGLERSWRAGLRVVNTYLVSNRVICSIYPLNDGQGCDEMKSIQLQYDYLQQYQDYVDAVNGGPGRGFFRIARSPEEVRQIAADGKLAITMGTETSEIFGCSAAGDTPRCTREDIVRGLDDLKSKGIMRNYLVHKFDNGLGGTRFDEGSTGVAINVGQMASTGHWWQVEKCTGPASDHSISFTDDKLAEALKLGFNVPAGTVLPVYPSGPVCNVRGLTEMGEFAVREMMKRGMVIAIDHMSVKTAQRVLDIAEEQNYPGLVSDHTWSDPNMQRRIVQLGGFVGAYASVAGGTGEHAEDSFPNEWRKIRSQAGGSLPGFAFASDVNGLGPQPARRNTAATAPLQYPFTINGVTFTRSRWANRTWDYNEVGVANYGMFADWYADVLVQAGPDAAAIRRDMENTTEQLVDNWKRTRASVPRG